MYYDLLRRKECSKQHFTPCAEEVYIKDWISCTHSKPTKHSKYSINSKPAKKPNNRAPFFFLTAQAKSKMKL